MSLVRFVDLKAQYRSIEREIRAAFDRVMDSASFVLGPEVAAFEEEFAAFCGARYCIGVESGTAALKLALQELGIGPGDEVILPANTYVASACAVSHVGATPVLVDINDFYHIDASAIASAITPRTKAIMPVHLYGQAVPLAPILQLARARGLKVIEDACQAHGALSEGHRVGSLSDAGCFSFYPGKNLGAYGDGGAIITNDRALSEALRLARDFGQKKKYEHITKGDNCRLDALQAAFLRVKLRHLDGWNARRREAAATYDALLTTIGLSPPAVLAAAAHVYHLYVVQVPDRDLARDLLREHEIETGIHYPIPIHLQPAYGDLHIAKGAFPITERACAHVVSLPMFPELQTADIKRVVGALDAHLHNRALVTNAAG